MATDDDKSKKKHPLPARRWLPAMLPHVPAVADSNRTVVPPDASGITMSIDQMSAVFLTPAELAARWGISKKTLANMRCNSTGPKFYRLGGIRYLLADVIEFERGRSFTSTGKCATHPKPAKPKTVASLDNPENKPTK